MGFPDLFKLEKLKIEAFSDPDRQQPVPDGTLEAMFNPTTIVQRFAVRVTTPSNAATGQKAEFDRVLPTTLNLQLLFDGTGVDQIGLLTLFGNNPTVAQRIDKLLTLCYKVEGKTHEPNYLKVTWGKIFREMQGDGFRGRLTSCTVTYNSFDREGSPMRATCDLILAGDDSLERQASAAGLSSPDVTHSRLVRQGDTLPLLTREIYGSPRHVVEVARANGIDHFRSLEPGRELVFPPIAKAP